jgi:hypothetical protein
LKKTKNDLNQQGVLCNQLLFPAALNGSVAAYPSLKESAHTYFAFLVIKIKSI